MSSYSDCERNEGKKCHKTNKLYIPLLIDVVAFLMLMMDNKNNLKVCYMILSNFFFFVVFLTILLI